MNTSVSLPRRTVNKKLKLSRLQSYRLFPPTSYSGMIRVKSVLSLLAEKAMCGATITEYIPDDLLSVDEFVRENNITRRRFYSWINAGKLPHFRINKQIVLVSRNAYEKTITEKGKQP